MAWPPAIGAAELSAFFHTNENVHENIYDTLGWLDYK